MAVVRLRLAVSSCLMSRVIPTHQHVKVVECGDGGGEVALGRVQLLNVGTHQHVKVVECGDGGGEVALGRVQLLYVPGDLLHHALALASLVFYVPGMQ
jgi:hypothetical protein